MSASQEPTPHTLGNSSPADDEGATAPPNVASVTVAYVPPTGTTSKFPTRFPAPFGRYQLLKLLGKGGMGAVYLAHDTQLDRRIALKIPLFRADEGSQLRERFYREGRSAATLHHANVCPVYDVGEMDGVPYMTMAYIEGKSLAAWVHAKPLTPRQSAALVRKLALALEEAHRKGVIHRDLKPANIMIDKRGEPVIMDFGLARRERAGDARLTQKGEVMGTPAYMPPEQVSGNPEAIGLACDIYSLGIILYELVAGQLPFSGEPMAMLSKVLLEEPPPPSKLRPELDAALETICLKAMAKKVEDRYASMAEFAAALQTYLKSPASQKPMVNAANATPTTAEAARCNAAADPTVVPIPQPTGIRPRQRGSLFWLTIAGGTGGLLGLVAVLVILNWPRSPSSSTPKSIAPIVREVPFESLFNGHDLSGWEAASGNPAVWNVKDGAMIFTVTDPPRQHGWLVTQRDYTDFLLRFEFQIASAGASSGVGLRMWPGSPKPLKIQIRDDSFAAFSARGPNVRTGALFGVTGSPRTGVGLRPLGEWNQMEIELRGWQLRVAVNGKETLQTMLNDDSVFRYLDAAPPSSGRIGLQHWLGHMRFRKLELKDLSVLEDASPKEENP
ncbi:MAG: protein kinase domain-containing protein [Gemmataceae bacterium]